MHPFEILLIVFLVLSSAILSASEIALFSLNRLQLRALKSEFGTVYTKVQKLINDPGGLLITILLFNEVINISLSTLITEWIISAFPNPASYFHDWTQGTVIAEWPEWFFQTVLGTIITAPIILILCEMTPKMMGARANMSVSIITTRLLYPLYLITNPIRHLLQSLALLIARTLKQKTNPILGKSEIIETSLSEEEIMTLMEQGHKEGTIHPVELDLIRNVLELDDLPASEAMTLLHLYPSLPPSVTISEAIQRTESTHDQRIPLIETGPGNTRRVVGVLLKRDLLSALTDKKTANEPVRNIALKPLTVSDTEKLSTILRRMRSKKTQVAIVENAKKIHIGVVTMDDILETILEDIKFDSFRNKKAKPLRHE